MHSSFSLTSTNIRKSLKGTAFTYKHEAHPEQQENWGWPNLPPHREPAERQDDYQLESVAKFQDIDAILYVYANK